MDVIEAIGTRISCRAFSDRRLSEETFDELRARIDNLNEESGLDFQLYGPEEDGFVISMNKAMFANDPPAYAALVGPDDPLSKEMLGFYGEDFVLYATQLGLGTCWVASTYDKETTRVELSDGESLHDVVPIGYAPDRMPLKQRMIRTTIRKKSKRPAKLFEGPMPLDEAPEWIQAAIDGVCAAPSAINSQPIVFTWEGGESPVRANIRDERTRLQFTDLGIAKCHFGIVAKACGMEGSWEWGDGGAYVTSP